jgi:hypothetical protein
MQARVQAGCAALLLVAAQASSVGHFLLAPHVVCPEHGELVHADALAQAHAPVDTAAPVRGATIAAAHDNREAEHADEHCTALGARREHAIVGSAAPCLSAALADAGSAPALADGAHHDARARYDVAPKQSPPV